MTSYEQGFLTKCAERGVNEAFAKGLLKLATKKLDSEVWEKLIDQFLKTGKGWKPPAVLRVNHTGGATVWSPAASNVGYKLERAAEEARIRRDWLRRHRDSKEGILRRVLGLGHSKGWLAEERSLERQAERAESKQRDLQRILDSLKSSHWGGEYDGNGISRGLVLGPEESYNAIMSNTARELAEAARKKDISKLHRMSSEFQEGFRGNRRDPAGRLASAQHALAEAVIGRVQYRPVAKHVTVH